MCDDFRLAANADIQKIRIWMIYQGALPTDYDLAIALDAGDSDPNNATIVWSETVPVTHVDTGDDRWGYDIWETTCQTYGIDAYPSLIAGFRYWFIFSFHGDEYWLVQAPVFGSYPWVGETLTTLANCLGIFGETADTFFELYDLELTLERETWGNIKSVF